MNDSQSYGLIGWFAKNPVAANLLMLFIIVAGRFQPLPLVRICSQEWKEILFR